MRKIFSILFIIFAVIFFAYGLLFFYSQTGEEDTQKLKDSCLLEEGKWLDAYSECEYINKDWCDSISGVFEECASACRHNPEAEICTMQCVPVCSPAN